MKSIKNLSIKSFTVFFSFSILFSLMAFTNPKDDVKTIKIGVVTRGGYAGGQYWNKGFKANEFSNFFKDYGFKVEFTVLDDFDASRKAFKYDEVDLLWTTIDAFPTEAQGLSEYNPKVVFITDWSRGGDAIVANKGINNYEDLKGKTIAVAPMTPSHTFLLWVLEQSNLTTNDVEILEVPSAIDAADAFKSKNVDAAVVWSPDDEDCIEKVVGSKILASTKDAKYIIADGFIAKQEFLDENEEIVQQLYEGWMKGAAEINHSREIRKEAGKILAEGLNVPFDFAMQAIYNVRLTNHGDNINFFGLNQDYQGITGQKLYNKMSIKYLKLGYMNKKAISWENVSTTNFVDNASLSPTDKQAAEK